MKKTVHFPVFLVFTLFVIALPVNTASAQPESTQTEFGWYAGVFGGYTLSSDASWKDYDFTYDLDIRDAYIFGVKFGVSFLSAESFSFEFEYSFLNPNLGSTLLATAGSDYNAIRGDVELHNFMFNAIVKFPAETIHPYIGLGLGSSCFDISVTSNQRIDGVDYRGRGAADDAVFAWQLLIGVDIDLADNLSLDIGYRYFDTSSLDDYYYYDHHYYDHHYYNYNRYHDDRTLDYHTGMFTVGITQRF